MTVARSESSPSPEPGGDASGGALGAAAAEPRRRTLVALALVTACTLALQVVLTRLFSAVLPYHFSFLAISLALLGAGAGALVTYVRADRFTGPTLTLLARWCAAFSLLLVLAPFVFVRLDFSQPGVNASFVLHLAIACGLAGLLCFASGVVVALAIGRYSQRIGVVYAWDLVGAGIGALAVVPALGWLDAVSLVAVSVVGAHALANATEQQAAPLATVARQFGGPAVAFIVSLGAVSAMLGVLLNLILGLSRVVLAMARRGDLPPMFARVNPTQSTPTAAVVLVGIVIAGLALVGSVKTTWSFSAFTVLVYYALTNLAAIRLREQERLYPRFSAWLGLLFCLFLAFWVEPRIWMIGLLLIAAGLVWQQVAKRLFLTPESDRSV